MYVLKITYEDGRDMYAVIESLFVDRFTPAGMRNDDFDKAQAIPLTKEQAMQWKEIYEASNSTRMIKIKRIEIEPA